MTVDPVNFGHFPSGKDDSTSSEDYGEAEIIIVKCCEECMNTLALSVPSIFPIMLLPRCHQSFQLTDEKLLKEGDSEIRI